MSRPIVFVYIEVANMISRRYPNAPRNFDIISKLYREDMLKLAKKAHEIKEDYAKITGRTADDKKKKSYLENKMSIINKKREDILYEINTIRRSADQSCLFLQINWADKCKPRIVA